MPSKESKARWRKTPKGKAMSRRWYLRWKSADPERYAKKLKQNAAYNRRPESRAAAKAKLLQDPKKIEGRKKAHDRWAQSKAGREWYQEKCRRYKAKKLGCATEAQLRLILDWERKWRRRKKVKCYWCREEFPPDQCHMDHIIALHNRGAHTIDNVCIACSPCNIRKQAKTLEQWNRSLAQPALL